MSQWKDDPPKGVNQLMESQLRMKKPPRMCSLAKLLLQALCHLLLCIDPWAGTYPCQLIVKHSRRIFRFCFGNVRNGQSAGSLSPGVGGKPGEQQSDMQPALGHFS